MDLIDGVAGSINDQHAFLDLLLVGCAAPSCSAGVEERLGSGYKVNTEDESLTDIVFLRFPRSSTSLVLI